MVVAGAWWEQVGKESFPVNCMLQHECYNTHKEKFFYAGVLALRSTEDKVASSSAER